VRHGLSSSTLPCDYHATPQLSTSPSSLVMSASPSASPTPVRAVPSPLPSRLEKAILPGPAHLTTTVVRLGVSLSHAVGERHGHGPKSNERRTLALTLHHRLERPF
jgi:hypothetical protein